MVELSPFVAQAGSDKPALTTEGRTQPMASATAAPTSTSSAPGSSTVAKACRNQPSSTSMSATAVRAFHRARHVLASTGQRGIPLVSVNTPAAKVDAVPDRRPQPDQHGDQ